MRSAEGLIAEEYEESKGEVQRTVAAKLGRDLIAGADLDAAYNEAWHALYMELVAEASIGNRKGFLITVTYRCALREQRASRRMGMADPANLDDFGVEPDIDARLDAELQVRQFVQGLRAQLADREVRAATLIYLYGLSRPEAARVIGIPPRRMEKLMDRASRRINEVIDVVRPGELCRELDSPVRALAVGLLDEEGGRYAIARDHLEGCAACRRKVLVLRGLGAIAPPIPGVLAVVGGAGAGASVGAGSTGLSIGKGAAAKVAFGKAALVKCGVDLSARVADLSQKALLVGSTVAATAVVAAGGTVAIVDGGPGSAPSVRGVEASKLSAGAADGYHAVPNFREPPRDLAHHHSERTVRHDPKAATHPPATHASSPHPERLQAPPAEETEVVTAPEEAVEASVEPTSEASIEPSAPVEPTVKSEPSAAPEPTEQEASSGPTTNAAVEFELR